MSFRILLVPGVNPDRWLRVWAERLRDVPAVLVHAEPADAVARLRAGDAEVALVRLPVDRDGLAVIPLYDETTVVVVPKDHVVTVVDEVPVADLADETLIVPDDDLLDWVRAPGTRFAGGEVTTTADAIELVAAGVGVVLLPQSVARLHQRRGLVALPVPEAPTTSVALVWVDERYDELTEEFVGIVRGRRANSSRGRGTTPDAPAKAEKKPRPAPTKKPTPGASGRTPMRQNTTKHRPRKGR